MVTKDIVSLPVKGRVLGAGACKAGVTAAVTLKWTLLSKIVIYNKMISPKLTFMLGFPGKCSTAIVIGG